MNCAGSADKPVSLVGVRAVTEKVPEVAVFFDLNKSLLDPKANEHLSFRECRIDGPAKVAVRSSGPDALKGIGKPAWTRDGK